MRRFLRPPDTGAMRERPPNFRDAAPCDRVASAAERVPKARRPMSSGAIPTRTALLCLMAVAASACNETKPAPTESAASIGVVRSALLMRKQFTIAAAKVNSNLTDFPVLYAAAVQQTPFDQLLPFNGGIDKQTRRNEIDTAFDITFFGTTVSGKRVQSETASGILIFRYSASAAVTSAK